MTTAESRDEAAYEQVAYVLLAWKTDLRQGVLRLLSNGWEMYQLGAFVTGGMPGLSPGLHVSDRVSILHVVATQADACRCLDRSCRTSLQDCLKDSRQVKGEMEMPLFVAESGVHGILCIRYEDLFVGDESEGCEVN